MGVFGGFIQKKARDATRFIVRADIGTKLRAHEAGAGNLVTSVSSDAAGGGWRAVAR
jgi:hypothetical protein